MTIAPQERAVNTSDIAPVLNSNALHGVEDARTLLTPDSTKLILVLVGLPARGKSLIGHKLEQFINWRGYRCQSFRVGSKRRGDTDEEAASPDIAGSGSTSSPSGGSPSRTQFSTASFFDPAKAYASAKRDKVRLRGRRTHHLSARARVRGCACGGSGEVVGSRPR